MPVTHILSLCILPQQHLAFKHNKTWRLLHYRIVVHCRYISINGLDTGLEETLSLQITLIWKKLLTPLRTERSYKDTSTNQRHGKSPIV